MTNALFHLFLDARSLPLQVYEAYKTFAEMNAARTSASSGDIQMFSCFREKSKDDIKESVRFGQMVDQIIEQNVLFQKRTDRVDSSLSKIFGEIMDGELSVSPDAVSDVLPQIADEDDISSSASSASSSSSSSASSSS